MHRIRDETREWSSQLPESIGSFKLSRSEVAVENTFEIFRYESPARHRTVIGCYDEATKEYKIRVRIGLNERCLTNFFAESFEQFTRHFDIDCINRLDDNEGGTNIFVDELNLPQWNYGRELPTSLNQFELFINPSQPIEFSNGSSIIINYVDFERARDLVIYYNIFSDEFNGEARIDGHTHVLYDFDAKTLPELEQRLSDKLADCLERIKNRALC